MECVGGLHDIRRPADEGLGLGPVEDRRTRVLAEPSAAPVVDGEPCEDQVRSALRALPPLVVEVLPRSISNEAESGRARIVEGADLPQVENRLFRRVKDATRISRVQVDVAGAAELVLVEACEVHPEHTV